MKIKTKTIKKNTEQKTYITTYLEQKNTCREKNDSDDDEKKERYY